MILSRRSLLTGLAATLAAPAVVRAGSLMPVKLFDPYYTRYLCAYSIGTDEMRLRVDRALFPLPNPRPGHGVQVVSPTEAHRWIPKAVIEGIRPGPGVQQYIDFALPGGHYHHPETGIPMASAFDAHLSVAAPTR
jgi:hypothetical protein